jgi:hypothetical protein
MSRRHSGVMPHRSPLAVGHDHAGWTRASRAHLSTARLDGLAEVANVATMFRLELASREVVEVAEAVHR